MSDKIRAFAENHRSWYEHCVTCNRCDAWSAGEHTVRAMIPFLCQWGRKNNFQYLELNRPKWAGGVISVEDEIGST